jgi:hypothetical protein
LIGPLLYCVHGRLAMVATDLVKGIAYYKFDLQFTISLCPTFYKCLCCCAATALTPVWRMLGLVNYMYSVIEEGSE